VSLSCKTNFYDDKDSKNISFILLPPTSKQKELPRDHKTKIEKSFLFVRFSKHVFKNYGFSKKRKMDKTNVRPRTLQKIWIKYYNETIRNTIVRGRKLARNLKRKDKRRWRFKDARVRERVRRKRTSRFYVYETIFVLGDLGIQNRRQHISELHTQVHIITAIVFHVNVI
jgi:hypothetical protein